MTISVALTGLVRSKSKLLDLYSSEKSFTAKNGMKKSKIKLMFEMC